MPSIVEELQRVALDERQPASSLLRMMRLAAAKLGRQETAAWAERELVGYAVDNEIPAYRTVSGDATYWNVFHGWSEIRFRDRETQERLSRFEVSSPISEIEALLSQPPGGVLRRAYPPEIIKIIEGRRGSAPQAGMTIGRAQLQKILSAVRDRVLDWTMELEKAGVRGEGLSFSEKEREAAAGVAPVTYNIGSVGSVTGVLGTVSGSATVSITAMQPAHLADLRSLADQIQQFAGAMGLDPSTHKQIVSAATQLSEEVAKPDPSVSAVKGILAAVRAIAEGAAGNVVASGVLALVQRLPF